MLRMMAKSITTKKGYVTREKCKRYWWEMKKSLSSTLKVQCLHLLKSRGIQTLRALLLACFALILISLLCPSVCFRGRCTCFRCYETTGFSFIVGRHHPRCQDEISFPAPTHTPPADCSFLGKLLSCFTRFLFEFWFCFSETHHLIPVLRPGQISQPGEDAESLIWCVILGLACNFLKGEILRGVFPLDRKKTKPGK